MSRLRFRCNLPLSSNWIFVSIVWKKLKSSNRLVAILILILIIQDLLFFLYAVTFKFYDVNIFAVLFM
jgi:hypothetical protein